MTVYAIDWGDGTSIRVGPSREYAERLLREASGPFLAKNPAPRFVEVSDPAQQSTQEKPMTMTAPTPAEFLASTEPDEEYDEPDSLDTLRTIAVIERRLAELEAEVRGAQPVSAPCTECEEMRAVAAVRTEQRDKIRDELLPAAEVRADSAEALVTEIEGIVKKSSSKVSLEVKGAIEAWRTPAEPEANSRSCCPSAEGGPHHDDCDADSGDPAPEGHISRAEREQMLAAGPAAVDSWSVEEWRSFARRYGYTGPDIDNMNRSQIRTMLGIEQPVAPAVE